MHCFYAALLIIFWCKKNGIFFTFKNEILKQADFASEWQKSCFRGLEIFKIFQGMMLPHPPIHRIPSAKNLDPPQLPVEYTEIVPT